MSRRAGRFCVQNHSMSHATESSVKTTAGCQQERILCWQQVQIDLQCIKFLASPLQYLRCTDGRQGRQLEITAKDEVTLPVLMRGDTLGVKNEKRPQKEPQPSLTWCPDSHVLLTVHNKTSHWLSIGVIRCSLTYYKSAEHSFLITVSQRQRNSQRNTDETEHTRQV